MIALLITVASFAQQDGHRIAIEIEGYEQPELYLGYHYGDKQYIQDTVEMNQSGQYVFEGEEALKPGIYLVVMAPDNKYFQVIVTEDEQHFSMKTNEADPAKGIVLQNAPDNQLFYDYLAFLDEQKPEADKLAQEIEATDDENKKEKLREKRSKIDKKVQDYQHRIINEHPNSLTAAIINANLPMDMPEFEGEEEKVKLKKWEYTKEHYFDNIRLNDPRLLRTPFLFQRVDYYVHKLQVQHPDTISKAIDHVLKQMEPAEETFKFYLIHFLNHYAKSNIVGMDAVYVHLVNKYYATGRAPWTEEEQLEKIIDNAKALEPLLIGKKTPNLKLEKRDGTPIELHDIESELTVLYFWRYDCGHCKKSTPAIKEFYEKYKDKGVKLVAVCAKFTDEIPGCWEYVDEKEIGNWMHLIDTYHRSRYMKVYNIKSTPQLYILDKDKTILSKRIGAEQLEEVISRILEQREKEEMEKGSK